MIVAVAVLPAASLTVTVAVAVAASAAVRRAADHAGAGIEGQPRRQARGAVLATSMPPLGLMDVIASPTFRDPGAL